MRRPSRLSVGEVIFALALLWLAVTVHGPAGAWLADALAQHGGASMALALLAGALWLATGLIVVAAVLAAVWGLIQAWRRRRP